jgi:hypothetical protein
VQKYKKKRGTVWATPTTRRFKCINKDTTLTTATNPDDDKSQRRQLDGDKSKGGNCAPRPTQRWQNKGRLWYVHSDDTQKYKKKLT